VSQNSRKTGKSREPLNSHFPNRSAIRRPCGRGSARQYASAAVTEEDSCLTSKVKRRTL